MPADLERSVADYRALAARYDRATRLINGLRRRAVAALELRAGQTVLDAGCGTGFCFAPILERIGPSGQLLAFDPSPELLAVACSRIAAEGWANVTLERTDAETFDAGGARPQALLFSYVHDVLQSQAALDKLLSQAARGARVALCGSVLWPAWAWPVNAWLRARHRRYMTNMENFERPWARIAPRLGDFRVARQGPGWRYLATGRLRAAG